MNLIINHQQHRGVGYNSRQEKQKGLERRDTEIPNTATL
jgi:hypothetical protein